MMKPILPVPVVTRPSSRWLQTLIFAWTLAAAAVLPAAGLAAPGAGARPPLQQGGSAPLVPQDLEVPRKIAKKQQRELMKANFEKMKRDADQLLGLAQSLQKELDKSSQDVLSIKVVNQAEKIEKLAKQIKDTAKGP